MSLEKPSMASSEYIQKPENISKIQLSSTKTQILFFVFCRFDVPSCHYVDALQRFVSFFVCPIFREVSVQNQLEIVQSEHEKNRFNDLWRVNQVLRLSISPFSLGFNLYLLRVFVCWIRKLCVRGNRISNC